MHFPFENSSQTKVSVPCATVPKNREKGRRGEKGEINMRKEECNKRERKKEKKKRKEKKG